MGLALWMLATAALGESSDWPQWGGPNRDFKPNVTGLAEVWPEEGPPVVWKRQLGEGFSAIAAAEGTLYTMYRRGAEEVVIALDAGNGGTKWESAAVAEFSEAYSMENGEGPHATPLVVGGRLFAVGSTGQFRALDRETGRLLWSHDLMADFDGTVRPNGYASSPVAYGETVILMVGGPGQAVMAFDQAEGDVVWRAQDFRNSASSPLLIELDGEPQLVVFMYSEIAGLDPASGKLLWSHPHEAEFGLNVSLPVWGADGRLFFSSGYGGGSRVLELARTDAGTEARELWAHTRMKIHFGNAVRVGGAVYGSSGQFGPAPFTAVDVATGKVLWRYRRYARASVVYADGRFILLDENGMLALATPGPEGLTVASEVELLAPPAWTVPTLVGTTLFVRDRKVMMAVDLGR